MTTNGRMRAAALAVIAVLVIGACGSSGGGSAADGEPCPPNGKAAKVTTIRVPKDHDTIQAAVCAAHVGDLVLVSPGVYNEAVDVTTPNITIRGTDRNKVILDGKFTKENGIRVLGTDGVVVENMTARNYVSNGFYWTGSDYYRGSYLTAYRNGDYAIYSFDAYHGQFDHSYGGGSPDAGFYIGECNRCDAVIDTVVSENNGLGYSGTNSGGDLYIVNSTFRNNRAGIVPNSGSYELCYPERETTIVGNLVHDNNNGKAPTIDLAQLAYGNGILVPGGVRNTIERNLVYGHDRNGIGLVPFPEGDANDVPPDPSAWNVPCEETHDDPVPKIPKSKCVDLGALDLGADVDQFFKPCVVLWQPLENRVVGNVVEDSGVADIAVGTLDLSASGVTTATLGNCFSGNTVTKTAPSALEALAPCDATPTATDWDAGALDLIGVFLDLPKDPPKLRWRTSPVPPAQESMPGSVTRRPERFRGPTAPDLTQIAVPVKPAST